MKTVQKETVTIVSGNFTTAGNYSGYAPDGVTRIHVPARLMESAGLSKDKPIPFPLYAIVVERKFNVLDTDGNPTEEQFTRDQAGSIFTEKAKMIEAFNSDALLKLETVADLKKSAKDLSLTEELIADLLAVAV